MRINGEKIKDLRLMKSWSQQHLADVCDVNIRTIQRVENTDNASSETIMALSVALEVDKDQFYWASDEWFLRFLPKSDFGMLIFIILILCLGAVLGFSINY